MSIEGRYTYVKFAPTLDYAIEMSKAKILPSEDVIEENIRIKEWDVSKEAVDRLRELGLNTIEGKGTDAIRQLATVLKRQAKDVKTHVPLFYSDKEDYKSAINYLEIFCYYTNSYENIANGNVNDRLNFKAITELERLNGMLKDGNIDSTAWKLEVKRVKKIVDKIFIGLDPIQQDSLSESHENAKKILSM